MERLITFLDFDVIVSENSIMRELPWTTNGRQDDKVWLSSSFRIMLFKMGIEKAGSINQLGRELGYRSRVHPGWSVRQIMLGKQPFPYDRLKALADYLEYPLEDIMKHRTMPAAITLASTKRALRESGMIYHLPP